jgi:hypothetical protein
MLLSLHFDDITQIMKLIIIINVRSASYVFYFYYSILINTQSKQSPLPIVAPITGPNRMNGRKGPLHKPPAFSALRSAQD